MAKLPIDKYLHFGHGSGKDLTLDAVTNIMLDAQIYDWNTALKHVPSRKLYGARVNELERKLQHEYLKLKSNIQFEDENKIFRESKFKPSKSFGNTVNKQKFSLDNDFSHQGHSKLGELYNK